MKFTYRVFFPETTQKCYKCEAPMWYRNGQYVCKNCGATISAGGTTIQTETGEVATSDQYQKGR